MRWLEDVWRMVFSAEVNIVLLGSLCRMRIMSSAGTF